MFLQEQLRGLVQRKLLSPGSGSSPEWKEAGGAAENNVKYE
jgi:hypothetical protein